MKTVSTKQFAPKIARYINGAPDFAIEQAVSDTVLEICKEAMCVSTDVCLTTKPGVDLYEIPVGDGLDVELVRHAYCSGWQLRPMTQDQLHRHFRPMDFREAEGLPMFYTFQKRNKLLLVPKPEHEYRVSMTCVVSICRDGEDVPELFYTDFMDVVVDGALARLYRTSGEAFTDAEAAVFYQQRYEQGLQGIKNQTNRDYTRTSGRVVYNRWAD